MANLIERVYADFPCRRSNGKAMITRDEFSRLFYPVLTALHKEVASLDSVLAVPANHLRRERNYHFGQRALRAYEIQLAGQELSQFDPTHNIIEREQQKPIYWGRLALSTGNRPQS